MCGIAGFYAFGENLPEKSKISKMFELLESRGRDASGFAFIRDGNLIVHKDAIKSSEMVKTEEWDKLQLEKIMIFHSRAKTQGSEKNMANNHPLYSKEGIAIVHNGMIHNDKEIFGKKQKRDGEVDSEAILAILSSRSKGDKIKHIFDKLIGSFAVAVIDKNDPDKLVLIKKDNPLVLYYNELEDILYFCSERQIMREGLGIQSESKHGFTLGEKNFHCYDMQNNHTLILNKDGVEIYREYSPKKEFFPKYNFLVDMDEIECPYCLGLTEYFYDHQENRCRHCGSPLKEEEIYELGYF